MNKALLSSFASLLTLKLGLNVESLGQLALERAVLRWERESGLPLEILLQVASSSTQGFFALAEQVVVPETWFFRERPIFGEITGHARKLVSHGQKKVRILSAPCASGEEPYSIAIALLSAGIPAHTIEIVGLDISARSLSTARAGVYGPNAFRETLSATEKSYFASENTDQQVTPIVKQIVRFEQHNLVEPLPSSLGEFDIIVCRNVLIYLTALNQENLISNLIGRLVNEGLLILTPAESSIQKDSRAATKKGGRIDCFIRREVPTMGTDEASESGNGTRSDTHVKPAQQNLVPPPQEQQTRVHLAELGQQIGQLKLAGAKEATRDGDNERAIALLNAHLLTEPYDLEAHLLLGVLAEAGGDIATAKKQYKQALYIEPANFEALSHLALLEARIGNLKQAELLTNRALRLLSERSTL